MAASEIFRNTQNQQAEDTLHEAAAAAKASKSDCDASKAALGSLLAEQAQQRNLTKQAHQRDIFQEIITESSSETTWSGVAEADQFIQLVNGDFVVAKAQQVSVSYSLRPVLMLTNFLHML
jgi:hypothetical protein